MKTSMGIDPSVTSTGIITLESDGSRLPELSRKPVIVRPKSGSRGMARLDYLVSTIEDLISEVDPDCIVLEGYSLNMRNSSSVIPLVEFGGLLRYSLYKSRDTWLDVKAPTLKKFVTGKGNAPKDLVIMSVFKRWSYEAPNNDLADAYGLACMGLLHIGCLFGSTIEQRVALKSVEIRSS